MLAGECAEIAMARNNHEPVDWEAILDGIFRGKTVMEYGAARKIYRQGQPADSRWLSQPQALRRTIELSIQAQRLESLDLPGDPKTLSFHREHVCLEIQEADDSLTGTTIA